MTDPHTDPRRVSTPRVLHQVSKSEWCGGTKIDGTKAHQAPRGAASGSQTYDPPVPAAPRAFFRRRGCLRPRLAPRAKTREFPRPVPGRAAPR